MPPGQTPVRSPDDPVATERRAREAAERHADRMRRLAEVATALSSALTALDVARVVVEETAAEIEADFGGVWLLDSDHARLELVAERGMLPSMRGQIASFALATANPLCVAVQTAEPVWLESWEEYARRFPLSEQRVRDIQAPRPHAFCCLPLRIGDQLLGGLCFGYMRPHPLRRGRSGVHQLAGPPLCPGHGPGPAVRAGHGSGAGARRLPVGCRP